MKKLTQKRISEILTDFCNKCTSPFIVKFDEGFMETITDCEDSWEDDNSNKMKEDLIRNYLLWFGWDRVEEYIEKGETIMSENEIINEYLNK